MENKLPVLDIDKILEEAKTILDSKARLLFLYKEYFDCSSRKFFHEDFESTHDYFNYFNKKRKYLDKILAEAKILKKQVFNIEKTIVESTRFKEIGEKLRFLENELGEYCRFFSIAGKSNYVLYSNYFIGISREINFAKGLIAKSAKPKYSNPKLSFSWQGTSADLIELFKKIRGVLIDQDTSEEAFKSIFEARPLEDIIPVRWHDDNGSELIYFIIRLGETNNISYSARANYRQMAGCFQKADGNPFNTKSFASLKQKLDINLSPQKRQVIDDLLKEF